jgi:hypothetical protein
MLLWAAGISSDISMPGMALPMLAAIAEPEEAMALLASPMLAGPTTTASSPSSWTAPRDARWRWSARARFSSMRWKTTAGRSPLRWREKSSPCSLYALAPNQIP